MFALVVHGGAGRIPRERVEGAREGCRRACAAGDAVLRAGGSALDAVEVTVRALEDDPRFNAGTGACLNAEGHISLDASICDGATARFGAVCDLPPFQNPILIARAILEEGRHALYAGEGAAEYALARGFSRAKEEALVTAAAREAYERFLVEREASTFTSGGTVGAVALDAAGRLAAATSTGGMTGKARGRVGDSPLPGAGTWADEHGAASATGHGEVILRALLTREAVDRLRTGALPEEAARQALAHMAARIAGASAGLILVSREGRVGFSHNTPSMSAAYQTEEMLAPEAYAQEA